VSTSAAWAAVIFLAAAWLALSALTAAGAFRRGRRRGLAVATGLCFPVAWVMWYLIDERRAGRRTVRRPGGQVPAGKATK
jgi:hypothetical protein